MSDSHSNAPAPADKPAKPYPDFSRFPQHPADHFKRETVEACREYPGGNHRLLRRHGVSAERLGVAGRPRG
jgi:hypothetical protein